jgi:hypothetical protein
MKQTINLSQFRDEFNSIRPNNFSYEGLEILFDFLEEVDPDLDLDVIALCCDYSESTIDNLIQDYDIDFDGVDPDEVDATVLDYINDRSVVLGVCFDGSIVYLNF